MKILITGTPGAGKTEISKELAKIMDLEYVNVKEIINNHKEVVDEIDNDELVINTKLKKILLKELPKDCIYETHLIEYCPIPDIYIILRTNPLELKKRLFERKYPKQKIMDNLEVEILDYFTQKIKSKKVIEFDTSKGSAKINAKKIMELLVLKKYGKGKISWIDKKYFTNLFWKNSALSLK